MKYYAIIKQFYIIASGNSEDEVIAKSVAQINRVFPKDEATDFEFKDSPRPTYVNIDLYKSTMDLRINVKGTDQLKPYKNIYRQIL